MGMSTPAVPYRGDDPHGPSSSTKLIPSARRRLPTLNLPTHPFGGDEVVEVTFEIEGLNYSLYEGLKELDEVRREKLDQEAHHCVWTALDRLSLSPNDVFATIGPGVVSALLLKYQNNCFPTLLDADWPLRIHAVVRCTRSAPGHSVVQAFESYVGTRDAMMPFIQLFQSTFGKIVDFLRVSIIDGNGRVTVSGGAEFRLYQQRRAAEVAEAEAAIEEERVREQEAQQRRDQQRRLLANTAHYRGGNGAGGGASRSLPGDRSYDHVGSADQRAARAYDHQGGRGDGSRSTTNVRNYSPHRRYDDDEPRSRFARGGYDDRHDGGYENVGGRRYGGREDIDDRRYDDDTDGDQYSRRSTHTTMSRGMMDGGAGARGASPSINRRASPRRTPRYGEDLLATTEEDEEERWISSRGGHDVVSSRPTGYRYSTDRRTVARRDGRSLSPRDLVDGLADGQGFYVKVTEMVPADTRRY